MLVYVIVIAFIILLNICINNSKLCKIKKRNIFVWLAAIVFILLFGLRDQNMGIDLMSPTNPGYLGAFETINETSWLAVLKNPRYQNYEFGFVLFIKAVGTICANGQFFLFCCASISIILVFEVIRKFSPNPLLSILIWMMSSHFLFMFSALRQSIAMAICFYSITFLFKRKPMPFIIGVLIASAFHLSALLMFVALLFYIINNNIKAEMFYRCLSFMLIFLIIIMPVPIFKIFLKIVGKTYDSNAAGHGTGLMAVMFLLLYILIILTRNRKDKKMNFAVNIYSMSVILQAFSQAHDLAGRTSCYFEMIFILALPVILCESTQIKNETVFYYQRRIKNKNTCVRWMCLDGVVWFKALVLGCYVAVGLYLISTTYWAEANPYVFFFMVG